MPFKEIRIFKFNWNFIALLLFLLFHIQTDLYSQNIPKNLIKPICSNQPLNTEAPENTKITNVRTQCSSFSALSSYLDFYYIKILSGTTFTFSVTPNGKVDYDFAAFLNPNWNNLSATNSQNIRGSQNNPISSGLYSIGLSLTATDLCEGPGSVGTPEPGYVRYFDVKPGDEIFIAIDRWSKADIGYSMDFEGGDAVLDCSIVGNTYKKCETTSSEKVLYEKEDFLSDLNEEYPNNVYKFYSEQENAELDKGPQIVFPIITDYNDGKPVKIFVRIENTSGGFIIVLKLFLKVTPLPLLLQEDYEFPHVCDDDGLGLATFDLRQSENILISNPTNYNFKYFGTAEEAVSGSMNFISNPESFTSRDTIVYVRIDTKPEDDDDVPCYVIGKLHLNVSKSTESMDTVETCSSYVWDNQILTSSGRYTAQFNNAAGCDSTAILQLIIYERDSLESSQTACGEYTWHDQVYDVSGSYKKVFQNIHGCDSTDILMLRIYPLFKDTIEQSSCNSYIWPINKNTYSESGIYNYPLKSIHGCDSTIVLMLEINPSFIQKDSIYAVGEYTWPINNITYNNSGIYSESLITNAGCDSLFYLDLTIQDNSHFFFPNIMSYGGANGYFTGYSDKGQLPILYLSVYDRWGNLVFHNENFPSNVPEEGWSGILSGRNVASGVYIWIALVENKDGSQRKYQGNITVVR